MLGCRGEQLELICHDTKAQVFRVCVVKALASSMFAQVRPKLPCESDTLLYGSLRPSLFFQKGAKSLFIHLLDCLPLRNPFL